MEVFISYSSREFEEANRLKTVLESNGISCWMAPQSIQAGSDYSAEIPSAIKHCDAFVLVLSAAAQESVWVPKELDLALTNSKPVIPFHIDESDLVDSFNFRLSNVQRIESFNRLSSAYRQLLAKLQALGGIQDTRQDPVVPSPVSFNQRPGTEDFLFAKEKAEESYAHGPIRVRGQESFWVLANIVNDCPDENDVAENVRLKISIHRTDEKTTLVRASILCPDASPKEVCSELRFSGDEPFTLRYFPGSAFMYSSAYGLHGSKGIALTDDILSENGTLLGFRRVDGKIPGGVNNAVTVSVKVKVIR